MIDHEHHERASTWAAGITRFAVCPVVEGALVRVGETPDTARDVVRAVRGMPGCEFWPDDLSWADTGMTHVRGHRQVTDAYLVALPERRPGAVLATLDEALAQVRPERTLLVPRL